VARISPEETLMSGILTMKAAALHASIVGAVIVFITCAPSVASAQAGSISGIVSDSTGLPVAGVEVTANGLREITSERGRFNLSGVPPGTVVIRARRLGFRPDSIRVQVSENLEANASILLVALPTSLRPVVVRTNKVEFKGRLAGYYERLDRRSSGYFITRAEIDRDNPRTLTQLLQRAPGMSQYRGRGGVSGVRMRGRNCWPLVWLDGTQMPSGEVDLDGISPASLHGIELYLGSTTAPMRYTAGRDLSSCGTIMLWSRGPDTDPITTRSREKPALETLIAGLAVFTADQVDRPAVANPEKPIGVAYPPALFAEKIPGKVTAEFVVAADGTVEDDTFDVVSSSDPLFSAAVRAALRSASFIPAMKNGRTVRQLVHLPFSFFPGK
jgi:TonB family protein